MEVVIMAKAKVKVKAKVVPETIVPETVVPETVVPEIPTPKPTLATATTADTTKPAKKPKVPVLEIIRGRMPIAMVFSIKFLETGSMSEIAAKYRTTMGKIDDIKKGANFGYVRETFKPTADMVKAIIPRCKELAAGKEILTAINGIGIATPDDEVAFAAIKDALRKKTPKVKTEAPVVETPIEMPIEMPITTVTDMDVEELTDDEDLLSLLG